MQNNFLRKDESLSKKYRDRRMQYRFTSGKEKAELFGSSFEKIGHHISNKTDTLHALNCKEN